jgi:glycyl-tRNA synthetase
VHINPAWVKYELCPEEVNGEYVTPHVIEPSYGIDRIVYALLEQSFDEGVVDDETRVVLHIPPKIAPIQVAVLPLLSRNNLIERAKEIKSLLRQNKLLVDYDDSGTIGRRYRRQDEAGTPFAVTIDHQTLEDNTVTIRNRDTMRQIRVSEDKIAETVCRLLSREVSFEDAGSLI